MIPVYKYFDIKAYVLMALLFHVASVITRTLDTKSLILVLT